MNRGDEEDIIYEGVVLNGVLSRKGERGTGLKIAGVL